MPEFLHSDRLRQLHDYYVRLTRQAKGYPSRLALDPSAVKTALPIVYLSNVTQVENQARFPFRLVGSQLVELFRQDSTGRYIRDMQLGGWEHHIRDAHLRVLESGAPVLTVKKMTLNNGREYFAEHLAMPMRLDDERIGLIFGGLEMVRIEQRVLRMDLEQIDWARDLHGVDVLERRELSPEEPAEAV
ncbi:PAS domain-containing protein [Oceanibaculum pacificum]|uniref:PAS domain-containing protein n=1 Tax=Oceanibaculum pacificum TaxID=580166 RepID=A0A154VTX9_9PROT|nr:PAS domain-containing protein [Oceanibaculum pacificum]KZD04688.1 hypothetical protein AUP43_12190 [Oceanibaculum pacificum]